MQRKSFRTMSCPIARSLERVGEWWSMLIMRDALYGLRRFDEFHDSLGIAPNMLARRLKALVAAGLLERRAYSTRPLRYEYVPTPRGREFRSVLIALLAFGNRHFAPDGRSVTIVDAETGAEADPVVVDRATGKLIREPEFAWVSGPAAGERTRQRFALRAKIRAADSAASISPATTEDGQNARRTGSARTAPVPEKAASRKNRPGRGAARNSRKESPR